MQMFLFILFCFSFVTSKCCLGFTCNGGASPRVSSCVRSSFQDDQQSVAFDPNREITLYDILDAPPTASREELKKRFVELAKLSHPDAQIGNNQVNIRDVPDFGEVAAAWRVLGHAETRKRYDRDLRRDLRAKKFSEKAHRFVDHAVDNVAVPFLRRTTAVGQSVADGVSKFSQRDSYKGKRQALKEVLEEAIRAGKQAGRATNKSI